jgi:hypothetical protein
MTRRATVAWLAGVMLLGVAGAARAQAPARDLMAPLTSEPQRVVGELRAKRELFPPDDRKLIDNLIAAVGKLQPGARLTPALAKEVIEPYVELMRRWAAGAPRDFDVQWRVASHIHSLGLQAEAAGHPHPELQADGLARARRILAGWPKEPKAHALVANMVDDMPTQLREFAACRELDPNEPLCRDSLDRLIAYLQQPRCEGGQIRRLTLHAAKETGYEQPRKLTLEPAPLANGDVKQVAQSLADPNSCEATMTPAGTKRLSALTKKVSERNGWTVMVIEGVQQPPQKTSWIENGRTNTPCQLCKTMARPPLPPELRRWAPPSPPRR